jgi:hypothetical protein
MIESRHNFPVDQQRLIFGGKQLQPYQSTLASHGVHSRCTLHLVLRLRGGMPKKGCKKSIAKEVRLSTMRAKAHYNGSTLQQSAFAGLIQQVSQAGYAPSCINQMNLDQLRALKPVADDVTRNDRVAKAVLDHFVPQLTQMKQQKAELEKAIKAVEDGFELGFAEQYCTDEGFEVDPFYDLIQNRIQNLEEQAIQQRERDAQQQMQHQMQNQMNAQMEAELQRRLAAMGVGPTPAPNGDVDM